MLQFTSMLNILEDFLIEKRYSYKWAEPRLCGFLPAAVQDMRPNCNLAPRLRYPLQATGRLHQPRAARG